MFWMLYMNFSFFFSSRSRHTRSTRDWSSDVCSSDLDHVGAGPEVQVVAVAEHDPRPQRAKLVGIDALDRRLRANGHEGRGWHVAVRSRQAAVPGGSVGRGDAEAHRMSIASPKE